MKKNIYIWSIMLLMVMVTGCREESDVVQNYAFNDGLNFKEAENSYAGKFKVLWKALNQNYSIWDYERSFGLDWDAVYDEFLPKYEALDQRNDVTNAELGKLLEETVAPLHDGHLVAQMKNHQTGDFVLVSPSKLRVSQRDDYQVSDNFTPNLNAYLPTAQGGNGDIEVYKEASTSFGEQLVAVYKKEGMGYQWASAEADRLRELPSRTDKEDFLLEGLDNFVSAFGTMIQHIIKGYSDADILQEYNQLALTYQYLQIPGLHSIHNGFLKQGIDVKYALFRNKVAYFYLSGFDLTPYMSDEYADQFFPGANAQTKEAIKQVYNVWDSWFKAVQELHAAGQLRGVIIDVRSNGGGMLNDYKYVLGSLLPSGGYDIGMARFKRGLGRYDYSPLVSARFPTLEESHDAISEPIVVLCNCGSVSMSEMTALGCKTLPNGTLIGKTTHGGLCALHGDASSYTIDYAGIVGEQDTTPVWLYIPTMVTMSKEGQIFEGIGLTPDIEVSFDQSLSKTTGRDTQLERALQFMNTGH